MLSRPAQYAILALVHLARQPADRLVPVAEIGEEAGVPKPFLVKLLGSLARRGLVATRRGPNGGATLARAAKSITLGEIVEIVEGRLGAERCFLGLPECSHAQPCPAHEQWTKVKRQIENTLFRRTLSELAGGSAGKEKRRKAGGRR